MKRILLLTYGWKRFVTYAWTTGINDYIQKNDRDFVLYQLQSWGNWNKNTSFNAGEYAVFDLIDFSKYDGAICDFTNFTDNERLEEIIKRLKDSGIPAVSVGFECKGFHYAGTDGYTATKGIFNHLYNVHKCRRFVFVGGEKNHFDNKEREKAFRECLKEKGIKLSDDMISDGDFTEATGITAALRYINADEYLAGKHVKKALPDAFICANDNIAVGLISEFEKHGIKCPDDVRVTGFDNLDKAMYYDPQITTATLNREKIGYEACRVLDLIMQGKEVNHTTFVEAEPIFSESCGCEYSGVINYRGYLKWQVDDSIFSTDLMDNLASIRADLDNVKSIKKFMDKIADTYSSMDCDGVFVVINNAVVNTNQDTFLPCGKFSVKNMTVVSARLHGLPVSNISSSDLYEMLMNEQRPGTNYFAMSLHMKDESAGVVILVNPRFIKKNWRVFEIQDTFLRALSDWYSRTKLIKSINTLTGIYDRDPLTKLYSRTAFSRKIIPAYAEWLKEEKSVALLFLDADGFKKINDNKGHDYGDRVLIRIANVIRETIPETGFGIRYGGDEFIFLFPPVESEEPMAMREKLYKNLRINGIFMSIGVAVTNDKYSESETEMRASFDRLLTRADKEMYRIKEEHHAVRK